MHAAMTNQDRDREIQVKPAEMPSLELPDFNQLGNNPTGMAGHLLFLYNLTWQLKAQHAVEIGLGGGNSSAAFLLALKQTGGILTSIDVEPRPQAQARINAMGMSDHWRFLCEPSDRAVRTVRSWQPIDVLMIDGLHSYNQCRRDYFNYAPLVRSGGYVLFHDSSTIQGVTEFTDELAARGLGGVNLDYCNGLWVFHKAGDVVW